MHLAYYAKIIETVVIEGNSFGLPYWFQPKKNNIKKIGFVILKPYISKSVFFNNPTIPISIKDRRTAENGNEGFYTRQDGRGTIYRNFVGRLYTTIIEFRCVDKSNREKVLDAHSFSSGVGQFEAVLGQSSTDRAVNEHYVCNSRVQVASLGFVIRSNAIPRIVTIPCIEYVIV
jgi:hypothetical protein